VWPFEEITHEDVVGYAVQFSPKRLSINLNFECDYILMFCGHLILKKVEKKNVLQRIDAVDVFEMCKGTTFC
jgi:hypothetical protein